MVEQCGRTVKQSWWNSVVEQGDSDGGTMGRVWWNSRTVMVEQCGDGTVKVEQCGRTVEQ